MNPQIVGMMEIVGGLALVIIGIFTFCLSCSPYSKIDKPSEDRSHISPFTEYNGVKYCGTGSHFYGSDGSIDGVKQKPIIIQVMKYYK